MAVTGAVVVSAHADSDADHRSGSPMTPYDEIVDELYGLAPAAFVTRRNELAREIKADGDRDLAGRIAKLRRPTQAAWAVNQWVRAHPDDSALIAGLASDLTAAQRRSAVDKMKTLSRRRQDLINESVTAVAATAEHAVGHGRHIAGEPTQPRRNLFGVDELPHMRFPRGMVGACHASTPVASRTASATCTPTSTARRTSATS